MNINKVLYEEPGKSHIEFMGNAANRLRESVNDLNGTIYVLTNQITSLNERMHNHERPIIDIQGISWQRLIFLSIVGIFIALIIKI